MMTDRTIRASDQDRERVVEILRTHYSEGRLTLEEFDERMTAAYAGKTWGDLLELTKDLPVEVPLGADHALAPVADRETAHGWPHRAVFPIAPLVPLLLMGLLISSVSWGGTGYGDHRHVAPFFPLLPLLLITFLFLRRGTRPGRGSRHR